jgi:hypothetical protein
MAKKDKKSKPESKTPELTKAKKALDAYLKENKLDPTKDWTKDKKHGKKITELVNKLNKERDKVAAAYPEKDADNNKKLVKLKEKKEKKSAGRTATKYDYPLIDGREMTSAEKKKYRMEQRKLASGNAPKEEKEAKKVKKEKVKEKPASDKKEKADKKKDKKKKKAAKEED